jgi:hypothetical protein
MVASYPGAIHTTFSTHSNVVEVIDASHPNDIQNEVFAIETYLGVNPHLSSVPTPITNFSYSNYISTNAPASVAARLTIAELGIVSDSHSQYIRKASDSGNVITTTSASTKGLVIKASAGQTANLLEFQDSTGTVLSSITSAGLLAGNVPLSTFTSKGDLVVGAGSSSILRQGVGSDGQILVADSTQTTGVKWASIGSATGTVSQTNGTVTTAANGSGVVRNVWTSTSAPSGGADGDIWIQYA